MVNTALLKADAEKLGILINDEQLQKFELLSELLVEQNKTMNLTAITDPDGIAVKHFADSISVLTAYSERCKGYGYRNGCRLSGHTPTDYATRH